MEAHYCSFARTLLESNARRAKMKHARLLSMILFLLVVGCRTYNVRLVDNFDENKVKKVKVPRKARPSFFVDDEDISKHCGKDRIVFASFFANAPREVNLYRLRIVICLARIIDLDLQQV